MNSFSRYYYWNSRITWLGYVWIVLLGLNLRDERVVDYPSIANPMHTVQKYLFCINYKDYNIPNQHGRANI